MQNRNRNLNPRNWARPIRALAILAWISVLVCGLSLTASAAQAPAEKPGPSNRWLFIIQTSHSMENRSENARQIAGILVLSGMNGQMRRGDTVGVWTFNQDLYAGVFPLQDFRPETARTTAQRVVAFLQEQKNEKSSHLEKVMPEVGTLIKASEFITVVIISDGSSKISGTPFDDKINETFSSWKSQQKKNSMPFITILRASHGNITDFVVDTPPWQLDLPPMSAELLPPPPAPKPAGIRLPPSTPSNAPAASLIVSGKKSDANPAPDPSVITVTASSNSATPILAAGSTNPAAIAGLVPAPVKVEEHPPATAPGTLQVMAAEVAKSNAPVVTVTSSAPPSLVATDLAAATPAASGTSTNATEAESHAAAPVASSSLKPLIPPNVMEFLTTAVLTPRNLWIGVGVLVVLMLGVMISRARQPEARTRIRISARSLDQEQQ
jgi:hypothetical protein